MSETDYWENWRGLGGDLKTRLINPISQPTFIIYFVVIMIAVGGIGCWLAIFENIGGEPTLQAQKSIISAFSTYSIAVLAAAMADVVLSQTARQSFKMLSLGIIALGVIFAVAGQQISSVQWGYVFSIFGLLLSWFLWYVANADNAKLHEPPPPPDASTGGDPTSPLAGNLSGLEL